ncbi:MAG: DEAD/DEAH box helicase [Clostridia bacterium]|nr:DEAD/DEAH box helicase [Clostridia bacterium]
MDNSTKKEEKKENVYKDRELRRLNAISEKIEDLAKSLESISDEELLDKTFEFKRRIGMGEKVYDMLPEAFAVASEAIHRKCGFKPHRVQLMGAISIFEGTGVEMKTGEGKTITGILPAYLNALTGEPVHIMTSNDYLASRDAETVSPVFEFLGMKVGSINSSLSRDEKRNAYNSDVVYGTTANFGFDFLRDNLVLKSEDKFTRGLGFAIIDEADSLLLDQARTPLILSDSAEISMEESKLYILASKFAETLTLEDVDVDDDRKVAVLKDVGLDKAEKFFGADFNELFDKYLFYINNAVNAKFAIEKDVDYIVRGDKVVLVDRNTGRPLPTHRFSEGLHQAIEAKEGVKISPESKVLGKITIQNYLRKYNRISGMSGTIKTCEEELRGIYGLDVVQIPTNKPVMRKDDTNIYSFAWEKYDAIIKNVLETNKTGQPVLIGTVSIEESEMIKEMLDKIGIHSNILNAKNLSEEAKIVANAGRLGSVTIATDMAGRGTDIKLGGNADVLYEIVNRAGLKLTYEDIKRDTKENREKVIALGGLKVIGSSLHNLVRVDGQLRGRAGRQGEVGESVFYTSVDDDIFADKSPEYKAALRAEIMRSMGPNGDRAKERILREIDKIQAINESVDFAARKSMITYDKEPSTQYDEFYKLRNEVLESNDISVIISNGADYLAERVIDCALNSSTDADYKNENYSRYKAVFERFDLGDVRFENLKSSKRKELIEKLSEKIYKSFPQGVVNGTAKTTILKTMDEAFIEHLSNIDMLKRDSGLGSFGESNPLLNFEERAHTMYNEMIDSILPEAVMELVEKTPRQFSFGKFNVPTNYRQNG